jgi:hypothetical protein
MAPLSLPLLRAIPKPGGCVQTPAMQVTALFESRCEFFEHAYVCFA